MRSLIRNVFPLASNAPPRSPKFFAVCLGGALSACGGAGDVPAVVAADPNGPAIEAAGPDGQAALGDANGLVPEEQVTVAGTCAAEIAAETFASALCSCEDTNVAGYLRTRGFRSGDGPDAPELLAGNVGVNRDYITAGYADIGGSFTVAGERDVAFGGFLNSGEDLRFNPAFDVAGVVDVERDAFLAGSVRAFGRVGIGRDLHMAAGAGFRGIALVDVGGVEHTEAITVEPPCPCGPGQLIDVPALVAAAETDNDNASVGLEPDDFNLVVGIGAELTLPTGRFYINQIAGVGAVTLHVTGKAALFVADDLLATGLFRVELAPDAEIDIFVRDNLVVTGAAAFGDSARPSATRVYVGGTGDVSIAGAAAFSGNLYAPSANVLIGGFGRVDGSVFGKNITAAGFLSVGYDASVGEGGEGCPPVEDGEIPRIR